MYCSIAGCERFHRSSMFAFLIEGRQQLRQFPQPDRVRRNLHVAHGELEGGRSGAGKRERNVLAQFLRVCPLSVAFEKLLQRA